MRVEAEALAGHGALYGDDRDVARRRAEAGHVLVSRLFGEVNDSCELAPDGGVATLVIDGRTVVRHGVLQTADLEDIRRRASEAAPALWRRMAELS
jgi:hypothetical protein